MTTREELKRAIESADCILGKAARHRDPWHFRDYRWLERERARLVHELRELDRAENSAAFASFANFIDRKSRTPGSRRRPFRPGEAS
jgi:hypothetical protein